MFSVSCSGCPKVRIPRERLSMTPAGKGRSIPSGSGFRREQSGPRRLGGRGPWILVRDFRVLEVVGEGDPDAAGFLEVVVVAGVVRYAARKIGAVGEEVRVEEVVDRCVQDDAVSEFIGGTQVSEAVALEGAELVACRDCRYAGAAGAAGAGFGADPGV